MLYLRGLKREGSFLVVVNKGIILCVTLFITCYAKKQIYFGNFFDHRNVEIVEVKKTKRSYVTTIINKATGDCFCVKQLFPETSSWLARHICEVFASLVAESANISVNRVCFILPGEKIPGKQYKNRIATLHTFVSGEPLSKHTVDLKQKRKIFSNKKTVPVGLAQDIIRSMAKSPDLPKIVAFDTFIGNADRSNENIFYNKDTDQFCGIDLERSLTYNLCKLSGEQIKKMLNDKKLFLTKKEIESLVIFRSTLNFLMQQNSLRQLLKKISQLIHEVTFDGMKISNKKLSHMNAIIVENYVDAKKLVCLIDELVAVQLKKMA